MTATPLTQCEDCPVRPIGSDARCAWCIAPGRYRRDPFSASDSLPPWLSNTEVDRSRRRSTVEAILRTYKPEEVNWSAVASLLGVSRQAVHQLKRRMMESAARPAENTAPIEEVYAAAASAPRRRSRRSATRADAPAAGATSDAKQGSGRASAGRES